MYPLVFSYTGDSGKGGPNYLMVQYFRNYIVQPAGSLSAASTVDSLSSSFIRSTNEANNLVPPPYSRATSPDLPFAAYSTVHGGALLPRSSSQQACSMLVADSSVGGPYRPCSVPNSSVHTATVRPTNHCSGAGAVAISESDSLEFQSYQSETPSHFDGAVRAGAATSSQSVNVMSATVHKAGGKRQTSLELVSCGTAGGACGVEEATNCRNPGIDRNEETYEVMHRNLSQYRRALRLHKEQKGTSSASFESRESRDICDYPKLNRSHYLNSNTDSSVSSLVNLGNNF